MDNCWEMPETFYNISGDLIQHWGPNVVGIFYGNFKNYIPVSWSRSNVFQFGILTQLALTKFAIKPLILFICFAADATGLKKRSTYGVLFGVISLCEMDVIHCMGCFFLSRETWNYIIFYIVGTWATIYFPSDCRIL